MNKAKIGLFLFLLPVLGWAQIKPGTTSYPAPTQAATPTPVAYNTNISINYVRTWEATRPNTNPSATDLADPTKYKQATAYFDGLGRPLQEVAKGASPDGLKDLVSMHVYDGFGRETINYLPYPSIPTVTDAGKFKTDPFAATTAYYNTNYTDQRPFSKTEIEPSPLNRPTKSMAPGNSWVGSGKGVSVSYEINAANEVVIWNIGYNIGDIPISAAYYDAGQLYRTITTDEHNSRVIEYKDKEGQVILKKVELPITAGTPSDKLSHNGWLCTYYVYDDFGLLRFVMQPKAVEYLAANSWVLPVPPSGGGGGNNVVDELCFRYEYDGRQRMIAKKVPGAGWVYMCYDKRDRLVYTQDANMRTGASFPLTTGQTGWMVTFYDALNRPTATALYMGGATDTRAVLQTQLDGLGGENPTPAISEANLYRLSYTYYDDYTFPGMAGFDAPQLIATQSNYQLIDEVADNTTQAISTRGVVTGTKIRVLNAAGTWLTSTTYYDVKGRPLQAISSNHKDGTDKVTTQYSFTGKVLSSVRSHSNPNASIAGTGATMIEETTLYKNNYVISTRQRLSGHNSGLAPAWHLINTMEYDDMGKLKRKEMGDGYILNGTIEKFFTNFSYNIRGWLTGINKAEYEALSPVFASQFFTPIFSQKISYDFGYNTGSQLNGNINGLEWTHAGDKMKRSFGYEYDAANRLKKADFAQNQIGTWTNSVLDFSVSDLNYDANGNIMRMKQYGLKLGTTNKVVDDMTYQYKTDANKLLKISDPLDDPNYKLGDFKDGANGTNGSDDYDYDNNGNLNIDRNKDISAVAYNYLNLPQSIVVNNKGTINYVYDAAGNKLQKQVVPVASPSNITTTDYLGPFQYQNNELQHIAHAEGRVRYVHNQDAYGQSTEYYWRYDFYYKDHLGNIRATVTEDQQTELYPACTLENIGTPNALGLEQSVYDLNTANIVSKAFAPNIPDYYNTNNLPPQHPSGIDGELSQQVYRLNAAISSAKMGYTKTLKVMAGDRVSIYGNSYFVQNSPNSNYSITALNLITSLFSGAGSSALFHGITEAQVAANTTGAIGPLTSFLNTPGPSGKPKAYINFIFLDEQFNFISGHSSPVGSPGQVYQHNNDADMQNILVGKSGYMYIYCSNETDENVFFDNLQIMHTTGPLLQEDDYYPFGLEMKMLGSRAAGKQENKLKYNGKELQSDFDLEWTDYGARMYDGQIGRFNGIDVLADKYSSWSPFSYCLNNPIFFVDPDGKDVKPSKAFLSTAYGRIFQDLRKNNAAFAKAISKYENSKNFNLTLKVDNAKVKAAGASAGTEAPVDKSNILTSANIVSYYLSSNTVPENANYKFTELGAALIVAHEVIHQKIALTTKASDDAHNTYNTERSTLVNILTEYSKDNQLDLSSETITALSYSGQQKSSDFKSYINGLAKENGTTYKEEKEKYDQLISNLIYQKKEDKK